MKRTIVATRKAKMPDVCAQCNQPIEPDDFCGELVNGRLIHIGCVVQ